MNIPKRSLWSATILSLALVAPTRAMDVDIATECGSCQFPTSVRVGGQCSGVYMGQGLVLTAAHCTDNVIEGTSDVYFGEHTETGERVASATIDHCVRHPDGEFDQTVFGEQSYDGVDLAYCILDDADPIPNIPIVPPMIPTGCERDWLAHQVYEGGTPPIVTAVGSGCADNYKGGNFCNDGVKRYVALQLLYQTGYAGSFTKLQVRRWGDSETGLMHGDSGGPLFDVLPDGTWRLLGVHHGTNTALDSSFSEAVPPYLHWIEAESGIDITPCHAFEDGEWLVTGNCDGELPLDTNEAGASWANACPSGLGGGGVLGCWGWPWMPGDVTIPTVSGAVLPNDLFLTAASTFVEKPAHSRAAAADEAAAKFAKYAVFPFLVSELPETMALSLLSDQRTQRGVRLMMQDILAP